MPKRADSESELFEYDPPLTARKLSWITEEAEARRDKPWALVRKASGKIGLVEKKDRYEEGETELVEVNTTSHQPDRVRMDEVTVRVENSASFPLPADADALFWTEASIEKFFFPYYVAQRLLDDFDLAKLRENFKTKELVAFFHVIPSRPYAIKTMPDTGGVVYVERLGAVPEIKVDSVSGYLRRK